jgi:hypothetical protein
LRFYVVYFYDVYVDEVVLCAAGDQACASFLQAVRQDDGVGAPAKICPKN